MTAVFAAARTLVSLLKKRQGTSTAAAAELEQHFSHSTSATDGTKKEEQPQAEEIWELLLHEQTQRLRAAANASAAGAGAMSAQPPVWRPPAAVAWLRQQRGRSPAPGADEAESEPATNQEAARGHPSGRFMRDYRVWGRQHSMPSTVAAASGTSGPDGVLLPAARTSTSASYKGSRVPTQNSPQMRLASSISEHMEHIEHDTSSKSAGLASLGASRGGALGESEHQQGTLAAREGPEKVSSRYKSEGRGLYMRNGVWRDWGLGSQAQTDLKEPDKPAAKASSQSGEDAGSRGPPETHISWGLYARSYASVQGKLSPSLRSQSGSLSSLPAARFKGTSNLDSAGES